MFDHQQLLYAHRLWMLLLKFLEYFSVTITSADFMKES